jgi:hypothetical protein
MFPFNLEDIAFERHKECLQQAEQRRLIKALERQQSNPGRVSQQVTTWAGAQMVKWGLKLQGHSVPPQLAATRDVINTPYGKEPLIG